MNRADAVVDILDATADVCRTTPVDGWTVEDFDQVQRNCVLVITECIGLDQKIRNERVRMAKVNATPRPVPMWPNIRTTGTTMPKPPKESGK